MEEWSQARHDPEGKVLGIIGMGGIGSALAKRASAFDMKIIYYNRNPNPNADASYEYVKSQESSSPVQTSSRSTSRSTLRPKSPSAQPSSPR